MHFEECNKVFTAAVGVDSVGDIYERTPGIYLPDSLSFGPVREVKARATPFGTINS